MMLPPITAEDSLYESSGHYRSSRPTSGINGVVPSQGPAGTYQATCMNCTYNFWAWDQLCCQCKDVHGNYHHTCTTGAYYWMSQTCEIFGAGCPDIANCNGTLTHTYTNVGCSVPAQTVRVARQLAGAAALRGAVGKAKAVSRLAAG